MTQFIRKVYEDDPTRPSNVFTPVGGADRRAHSISVESNVRVRREASTVRNLTSNHFMIRSESELNEFDLKTHFMGGFINVCGWSTLFLIDFGTPYLLEYDSASNKLVSHESQERVF